jgi:hypothetical protein
VPSSQRPELCRHFARVAWSCAFYLTMRPDWEQFGWTDRPSEWRDKDVLQLSAPIQKEDEGIIEIQIQIR